MSNEAKTAKSPISQERIFLIIMVLTFAVAAVFFVKNLLGGNMQSAVIIGVCLAVFAVAVFAMRKLHAPGTVQMMTLSVLLVLLVLFISLNSGDYYSDDFPLFLALLGLTGLYLEPKCTAVQSVAADIAFVVMYLAHPEKAESLSQYIMCFLIFNVAAFVNFMVIRRGRAFIELAGTRAAEAERLLETVKTMGAELQNNYSDSSQGVAGLRVANQQLEQNTHTLLQGSRSVQRESQEFAQACGEVQSCARVTGESVAQMEQGLHNMEGIMAGSKDPMQAMYAQLKAVSDTVQQTVEVFEQLQDHIRHISGLTGKLDNIASNTKLLALNASVEAARAGEYGVGFAVVAGEVESLAADSSSCSTEVTGVVEQIKKQVNVSADQLSGSYQAVKNLEETLYTLDHGFIAMGPQFQTMFQSLEQQVQSFTRMNAMFDNLESKAADMNNAANDNRATVDAILDAMQAYKSCTDHIMEDTKALRDLSISLVKSSAK